MIVYHSYLNLVLQPAIRVLRAVYWQILKKLYGTRMLHARHTQGFLPVDCPYVPRRRKRVCKFFAAGALRSQSAGSTFGARTGHVRVPYLNDWKVTCSAGLLRSANLEKGCGARTGIRPYGRLKVYRISTMYTFCL